MLTNFFLKDITKYPEILDYFLVRRQWSVEDPTPLSIFLMHIGGRAKPEIGQVL